MSKPIEVEKRVKALFEKIQRGPVYIAKKRYNHLVVHGGGMKIVGYVGSIQALFDSQIMNGVTECTGSSAGALVLAMCLIGYHPQELLYFGHYFDFSRMNDPSIDKLIEKYGFNEGENFEYTIKRMIKEKTGSDEMTLKQLFEKTGIKFNIIITNVKTAISLALNHETEPEMDLSLAVRISCSIPIVYAPIKYRGEFWVDGELSCLSITHNMEDDELQQTFALRFMESNPIDEPKNVGEYLIQLAFGLANGFSKESSRTIKYINRLSCDIHSLEFSLSKELLKPIFNECYQQTMRYIKERDIWDA